MLEKDLKIDKFVKSCMNNTYSNGAKENNEWYVKCLEKAKDTEDFLQYYFSTYDKKIVCCQAYGELLKGSTHYAGFDMHVKSILYNANKIFLTCSDIGSLKIGNEQCSFYIRNGYGDGEMYGFIFDKDNEYISAIDHFMEYSSLVDGKFDIYDYDCGDDVLCSIEGKYMIYYFNGNVAFVEVN